MSTKINGYQILNGSLTGAKLAPGTITIDKLSISLATTDLSDVGGAVNAANGLVELNGSGQLPALDGSLLTGVVATIPPLATTNLTDVGGAINTANGLVELDGSGKLPALDGSQLTNLPGGGGVTIPLVLTGTDDAGPQILLTLSKLDFGSTIFSQFYGGIDGTSTGLMLSGSGSASFPSFTFMCTSSFMGIGTASPAYSIDSNGDINTATMFRVAGFPLVSTNLSDVGGSVNTANGLAKLNGSGVLDLAGNVNTSGTYLVSGTQIASSNLSDGGSLISWADAFGGASAGDVAVVTGHRTIGANQVGSGSFTWDGDIATVTGSGGVQQSARISGSSGRYGLEVYRPFVSNADALAIYAHSQGGLGWKMKALYTDGSFQMDIDGVSTGFANAISVSGSDGSVGMGYGLRVSGSMSVVDGTQGTGKVFTSDSSGGGSWQTLPGGASGSFTTSDSKTVTVSDGLITSIV